MKRLEDGSEEAKGVARALARKAWATPGGITIKDAFEAVQNGLREAGHELPERAINNALLRGLAFQFARLAWDAGFATVEDVARIVIHNLDEQAEFRFFPEGDARQIAVDALADRQKAQKASDRPGESEGVS